MNRMIAIGLVLVGLSACRYEDPYAEADKKTPAPPAAATPVTLQVTYLSNALLDDGLAHTPETSFKVGQPIYLTVALTGSGTAKVKARLQATEQDTRELAVLERNVGVAGRQVVTLPTGFAPAPGTYYVSVIVDGVPSWGLPFTLAP